MRNLFIKNIIKLYNFIYNIFKIILNLFIEVIKLFNFLMCSLRVN